MLLIARIFFIALTLTSLLWGTAAFEEERPVYVPPSAQMPEEEGREALLYLSLENLPEKVYVGEIFPVTVKITSLNKHLPYIVTTEGGRHIRVIDGPRRVAPRAINRLTFYLQATDTPATLPRFVVRYEDGSDKAVSAPASLTAVRLNPPNHFCGVLARTMRLRNYQASTYDKGRNILVLEIDASFANLRDFHLSGALKEGIDSLKGTLGERQMVYYAILPENIEQVRFSYFNLTKNRYETFRIPVLVKRSSVSTQTNLDPQASEFTRFKIAVTLFFILLWLLLWWRTRRWRYPFYVTLATAYLLTYLIPLKKVCLKRNAVVYLLPTPQSTPFLRLETQTEAKEMAVRGDYVKIQLPNNRIGWVKHEDLCQN